jgi:hypothetical protein
MASALPAASSSAGVPRDLSHLLGCPTADATLRQQAVRGDLAESGETGGQAFLDVLGLAFRRQSALWMTGLHGWCRWAWSCRLVCCSVGRGRCDARFSAPRAPLSAICLVGPRAAGPEALTGTRATGDRILGDTRSRWYVAAFRNRRVERTGADGLAGEFGKAPKEPWIIGSNDVSRPGEEMSRDQPFCRLPWRLPLASSGGLDRLSRRQ